MNLTIFIYESVTVTVRISFAVSVFQGFQMPMSRPRGSIKYAYTGGSVSPQLGIINGGGL